MLGSCKNCIYWDGECNGINWDEDGKPKDNEALVQVRVADDHGLSVKIKTGPDFGCTLWQSRTGHL